MNMRITAENAALQSVLISGIDPRKNKDERFGMHCMLLQWILECKTGALIHPIITNMDLCGHRTAPQYRSGTRAAEATLMPNACYVRQLLKCWWFRIQCELPNVRTMDEGRQREWVWRQHDFLICLEPFESANGRTARAVYYMLSTALRHEIHIIGADKAAAYYAHKRDFRLNEFAPRMRERGYIS